MTVTPEAEDTRNPTRPRPPRGRLSRTISHWATELVAVVFVVLAALIVLGNFARTPWGATLMFNSDSVVLPLIETSIQDGERFNWVFSSQIFLFPEAPLFFLSSLFTDNVLVAQVVNVVLNLVILYLLFRVIAHILATDSRHRFLEICASLAVTGWFAAFVLLERDAAVNRWDVAGTYLIPTYYPGTIMVALACVALSLWFTRSFTTIPSTRRMVVFSALTVVIVGLSVTSNPLTLLVAVAPAMATIFVVWFFGRVHSRTVLVSLGALGLASIVGMVGNRMLDAYLAASMGRYLQPDLIPDSLSLLRGVGSHLLSTPAGTFKLLMLAFIVGLSLLTFLWGLFQQTRPRLRPRISTAEFYVSAFASISAISLVLGMVATGSTTTRYFASLFVLPLLTVLALALHMIRNLLATVDAPDRRRSLARFSSGVAVLALVAVSALGLSNLPTVATLTDRNQFTLDDCLDGWLGTRQADGVSSFWVARVVDLYGTQQGRVLQVDPDLTVYPWMNNLDAYADRTFSYVLQDEFIQPEALAALGPPAQVVSCPGYTIYDFSGTEGEQRLTRIVQDTVAEEDRARGFDD